MPGKMDNSFYMVRNLALFVSLALFALIAGFFYAFSVCVMPGLDRIAPDEAIHAMQAINAAVRNPVFFVTFFLTPAAGLITAVILFTGGEKLPALFAGLASAIYLAGAFSPTSSVNVPMNVELAALDPAAIGENAHQLWRDYSEKWTFWNSLRTFFSTLSVLAIGAAIFKARNGKPA